jgi:outer membrane protein TolC
MGRPQRVHSIAQLERLSDRPGQPIREQLDEWTRRALAQRPDLVQLTIQEEIANQEMSRARAGHYPTLALQGEYEINTETFSDSQDGYTVGAMLRLNLFRGRRISAQVAEARATLARIRSMRDGLALGVRVETQRAYYEAQSAWQSIQVAQTAVEQAAEGLRIVTNRYENGLLALVSLLDAQVSLQQAQTQHFKAVHDYQVSRIALALAGGVIDEAWGQ